MVPGRTSALVSVKGSLNIAIIACLDVLPAALVINFSRGFSYDMELQRVSFFGFTIIGDAERIFFDDRWFFSGNIPRNPWSVRSNVMGKAANPITYVEKNDPPFLIIHGEKDDLVSPRHSQLLRSWLTLAGVQNELVIVKNAPHYGEMFDVDEVREKVMGFLQQHLK